MRQGKVATSAWSVNVAHIRNLLSFLVWMCRTFSMNTQRDNRNTKNLTRDLSLLVLVAARPLTRAYALLAEVIRAGRNQDSAR